MRLAAASLEHCCTPAVSLCSHRGCMGVPRGISECGSAQQSCNSSALSLCSLPGLVWALLIKDAVLVLACLPLSGRQQELKVHAPLMTFWPQSPVCRLFPIAAHPQLLTPSLALMWQDELMVSESVKACLDSVYSSIGSSIGRETSDQPGVAARGLI